MFRTPPGRPDLALRAWVPSLAADGEANTAIAKRIGVSRPTVIGWRERYAERGLAGLDESRGRVGMRVVDHGKIVA
ncbi:helix-turn-helix domain-containing protein [Kribbella sp. NPDC023855]|uniref:helix-turn-helix domain-containing protein n=1 Tax=Kribbella sp. NPDC023855 TaxID=3154698 RepID=UPI0033C7EF57